MSGGAVEIRGGAVEACVEIRGAAVEALQRFESCSLVEAPSVIQV